MKSEVISKKGSAHAVCNPDPLGKALIELEDIGTEQEVRQKIKRRLGAKFA
ncbi:MAG: hypothetical protein HQ498_00175 [Pseudohongiella sp.]|nr:hypothetical protein [Pseudohongiella sp.]